MKENIFLEKPIENSGEDLFDVNVHVQNLENAIENGAKFISIDGEHGSGKSSILNLLQESEKEKKKKSKFVNINFLNINEKLDEKNAEKNISNYHRYFVNQVANDICDDPFEIEKIFYNNHISYSVTNPSGNKFWRIIVDKILLVLTSYMVLYLTYTTMFQNVEALKFFFIHSNKITPLVLISIFVLVIIYGYGIYKPDKQENSPMLEIDKCRNNFCKIVYTQFNRNLIIKRKEKRKLFLVIDDLDRINNELQVGIISLLYNEYYPLKMKDVELIFIFMMDTISIKSELNKNNLSSEKLFDYIVHVANNQKHIVRHLTNQTINSTKTLNEIFNNKEIRKKEYLVNLICKEYSSIRNIKHFFNKLIVKYEYLKAKNVKNINYDEMIITCFLLDNINTSILDEILSCILNNEIIDEVSNKEVGSNYLDIIKDAYKNSIFDVDYYIYLYNFINIDDMLNLKENEIYKITEKNMYDIKVEETNKIIKYLESDDVRFDKVFYEIFSNLDNDTKIILLGSKKFCNYLIELGNFFKTVDITNAYKNPYGYFLCDNLNLNLAAKNSVILDLKNTKDIYNTQRTEQTAKDFRENFILFLENMNSRILQFPLNEYFPLVAIDDTKYELLFKKIKIDNFEIGYELFYKDIITFDKIKNKIDDDFLTKIDKIEKNKSLSIKQKIIDNSNDFNLLVKIISNSKESFANIDNIYDKMIASDTIMVFNDLRKILDKYGYNKKLDKYILHYLNEETWENTLVKYIIKNKYDLSMGIINALDNLNTKYVFNEFYEDMFITEEVYRPYIYSQLINEKKFKIHIKLLSQKKYQESLFDVYKKVGNWAKDYECTPGYSNFIVSVFDDYNFSEKEFWKIIILIPKLKSIASLDKILMSLKKYNKLESFYKYCAKKNVLVSKSFIEYLHSYATELGITPGLKGNLTKKYKLMAQTKIRRTNKITK